MFWCKLIMAAAVSGEVFWEWNNNPAAAEWFVTMSGSNAASLLLKSALNCLGSATRTTAERERSVKVESNTSFDILINWVMKQWECEVWGVIRWLPAKVGASCAVIGPLGQLSGRRPGAWCICSVLSVSPAPAHVPVFPSSLPCYGLQEIPDLNIVQIKHVGFPLLHNFSIYRITGV